MTRRLSLLALGGLALAACSAPLQGSEADLHAIATPDPVPQVVRAAPQPPPGPTPVHGQFRAWVPRDVAPSGDIIEGHWLTISATPPPVEVLEPAMPMPRAPRGILGQKPKPATQTMVPRGAPGIVDREPAPATAPQQASPLLTPEVQRFLQQRQIPLGTPTLGGQ